MQRGGESQTRNRRSLPYSLNDMKTFTAKHINCEMLKAFFWDQKQDTNVHCYIYLILYRGLVSIRKRNTSYEECRGRRKVVIICRWY